ncbi:glycosyl transferase [Stenotrophomonas maltophilia]|uniref:UDP-N-acetylglucosamine--LPS N-acetylglucosamine transferase n=1 Tax=Stenotrophomonas maltophilia TaxID=40324 RepID=UPI000A2FE7F9|nr:UDP-N-acetylglucosamine--LPS N-acetylglucosamine transferase [Stenotrophomonas maltophilia]ARQ91751.1 glycosyl transferase [Stenotrophomonas maltophilia]PZT01782.1 glycosyl transferase [Stenotrophomonas maltophilia]
MKIAAIASGGGHWEQLMLMRPALASAEVLYLTTLDGLPQRSGISSFALLKECNRNDLAAIGVNSWRILNAFRKFRPDVVISTGALPGLIALTIAKFVFRARTIWVDSIANGERLSMSGKYAKKFADLTLSQWEDVAATEQVQYRGAVL